MFSFTYSILIFSIFSGNVERQMYKGFDTGERFVHIKTPDVIPYQLLLNSTCIPVTIIYPKQDRYNIARRKSFRSQININLKTPDPDAEGNSPNVTGNSPKLTGNSPSISQEPGTSRQEPSFFSKSTGITLTSADVENNVFQFPNSPAQPAPTQNSKKKPIAATLSPNAAKEPKSTCESPSTFRKFAQRHANSIRKHENSQPPSPAPFPNTKIVRRPSVNFRNGPGESLTKSRAQDGYLNEFGSGYMRERSASDASSGRQSICRRKLSITGHEGSTKIPWCGCWGIGCC